MLTNKKFVQTQKQSSTDQRIKLRQSHNYILKYLTGGNSLEC